MIRVSVHLRGEDVKTNWSHMRQSATCPEYGYYELSDGFSSVEVFFAEPDQLLNVITDLNRLHCDWLKRREEDHREVQPQETGEPVG